MGRHSNKYRKEHSETYVRFELLRCEQAVQVEHRLRDTGHELQYLVRQSRMRDVVIFLVPEIYT